MTVKQAMEAISTAELARLTYDLEMGNPAFTSVPSLPDLVVGVYLDKIARLEVIETFGKWATAKIRPRGEI